MTDTLRKTYVFRLYPTPIQETALVEVLTICREVYNSLVNWRKHDFEVKGQSPNYYEQKKALPVWKRARCASGALVHPELRQIHSQTLQDVVRRVDLAFQAFFRRVKAGETAGYPRLKGIGQYDSFTFTQGGYAVGTDRLALFKVGAVKAVFHRAIKGTVKTLTIRKRGGKWFACFSCEVEAENLPDSAESVGIDVGLMRFATLSDGTTVANPRFFRRDEKALAKAGRRQAKTKKRSAERRKANKVLSRIHERIRNRRHDFVHQLARRLVNHYGTIAVENLNVKGMVKNHCLSKSISDASWSMFRTVLTQKAESAARQLVAIQPAYTSQDCSDCGFRIRKKLSERVHSCPKCGLVLDRDHNAALNIIGLGLQTIGSFAQARTESVEAARFVGAE
ncbi:MAG: RNA-guided endonuclease TnpB family protein [Armatimonadota bacterium]